MVNQPSQELTDNVSPNQNLMMDQSAGHPLELQGHQYQYSVRTQQEQPMLYQPVIMRNKQKMLQ